MVRGCRAHLQLHQSLHPIPERHRRALGLGDFAVSLRQIPSWRRRLCLQPADGRQRPGRQARRIQITRCGNRAADRVFLSNREPRRIPQSQRLLRVQRQQPAARMDGVRHVLGRGTGTEVGATDVSKGHDAPTLTAAFGRRDGFHPPRAIATPTNAAPTATIERPVAHGRNPAQRPSAYPHTNSIPMATALERRSANRTSPIRMNGMTIGNVDRKLSKQIHIAPSPSRFVNRGRSGSGNWSRLCRINSSWSGGKTDPSTGGNASAMMRCASAISAAVRTACNCTALRPRWLKRAIRNTLASMIPQAKLQPSAARRMVRTWMRSAVTTPSVKVKVSAIIKPNRISEILSIGSRIRSDDVAENGASGSTAVWIGSFSIAVTDADAARPYPSRRRDYRGWRLCRGPRHFSKCYPGE